MKRFSFLMALMSLFLALVSVSCGPASSPAATSAPAATNTPTTVPASTSAPTAVSTPAATSSVPQRIISLAPSTTEILFAIGAGPRVVAVDDFSDYPTEVSSLTKIGGSNMSYNVEQIVALTPDVIFAAGTVPAEVVQQLEALKLTVVVLGTESTTFASVSEDILQAGQVVGADVEAQALVAAIQQKVETIKLVVAKASTKPKVFWELDATDPTKPFTVGPGNFVNDLIDMAGGVNIFADASSPYPQVSAEQIVAANPDLIILSDAAYGVTPESVGERAGWGDIAAVKNGQVLPIDDNLVSRPGPRIADGLEATAKLIHPELFK